MGTPTSDSETQELIDHLLNTQSRLEVVVRMHQWVDRFLGRSIAARVPNPNLLQIDRLHFPERLSIAAALGVLTEHDLPFMKELNRLRNGLAHRLASVSDVAVEALRQSLSPVARDLIPTMVKDARKNGDFLGDDDAMAALRVMGVLATVAVATTERVAISGGAIHLDLQDDGSMKLWHDIMRASDQQKPEGREE